MTNNFIGDADTVIKVMEHGRTRDKGLQTVSE